MGLIDVILNDKTPDEVMAIVREIRQLGYIQTIDFDFEYHPPRNDAITGHILYNRYTIFTFYKEELASYFVLRYQ